MALFENLTARLSRTVDTLRGRGRITEENVGESLREVRMALLEADVALPVVKTFIERVKLKALGAEVAASLSPGQAFVGILHQELVALMGGEPSSTKRGHPSGQPVPGAGCRRRPVQATGWRSLPSRAPSA